MLERVGEMRAMRKRAVVVVIRMLTEAERHLVLVVGVYTYPL